MYRTTNPQAVTMNRTGYAVLFWAMVTTAAIQAQTAWNAHNRTIRFTENRGQIIDTKGERRPDILYTTGSGGVQVYLRRSGISYVFTRIENAPDPAERMRPDLTTEERIALDSATTITCYRMDMELVGANPSARVTSEEAGEDYTNYYLGHCPDGITHVRSYGRVIYHEIYPSIDMVLYTGEYGGVKYDFVVKPGGRVQDIRLQYIGADSLHVTEQGTIRVANMLGTIEEGIPVVYQQGTHGFAPQRQEVESQYQLERDVIGFTVEQYDPAQPLVIDPTLIWSTYYGGSSMELVEDAGIDRTGNLLICGTSYSASFPVSSGAFQTVFA
jgi:hypothetical protein